MRFVHVPLILIGLQGSAPALAPVGAQRPAMQANLGTHHYSVNASPAAQRYFDQGLRLFWAFNHAEAIRSFREAERLDSTCAMCSFGVALAYGPNINAPMTRVAAEHLASLARGPRVRLSPSLRPGVPPAGLGGANNAVTSGRVRGRSVARAGGAERANPRWRQPRPRRRRR